MSILPMHARNAGQALHLLLPLLLLVSTWSSNAMAQHAWKTSDWTVECMEVSEGTCKDTEEAGANAYFNDSLKDASQWLDGLGFEGPAIEYRAGTNTYVAYISDVDNEDAKGNQNSIGVYYPEDAQLYLTSDKYFAIGEGDTQEERAADLAFDTKSMGTVVHEMFHAVQYGYYRDGSRVRDWITEGMADSVKLAWLRRSMPDESLSGNARAFDYPLHKPRNQDDAYATSIFWRGVGKLLGSPDTTGYLHVILEQDLATNWGLGGVDEGLREFDPDGLYNVYPEFIAKFTDNVLFFDDLDQLSMVYDDAKKVEKSVRGTVREVAANAIKVSVNVPTGKTANLEIELATHHDDLHLIVDGKRLDKSAGSGRNVFHTTVEGMRGEQTLLVRVANVARKAIDSGERIYRLDFTLRPTTGKSQCTVTAKMRIEPLGTYKFYIKNGKKVPIQRTESIVGVATIHDSQHHLALSFEDEQGHMGSRLFTIDISPLAIGGPAKQVSTRGEFGDTSPEAGPYKVELGIEENADPGDVDGWDGITLREAANSGLGFPERLALRRLRGEFRATRIQAPECCVGYAQTISGTFDAGNGPYQCEGGVEMMEDAYKKMEDVFNDTPERKADPSKLDGLLD